MSTSKSARGGWQHLTAKQRAFLEHYLGDSDGRRNATGAYRRAFNTSATPQRVSEMAQELLKKPKIAAVVAEADRRAAAAVEEVVTRYVISRVRVLEELARPAFANMLDYLAIQPNGTAVIDLSRLTRDQAAAIAEVTVDTYVEGRGEDAREVKRIRLKLHGKREALAEIARLQGYTKPERHEVSGASGGPIETKQLGGFGRDLMEQLFLEVAERRKAGEAAAKAVAQAGDNDGDRRVH